jgi:hypothetical protein
LTNEKSGLSLLAVLARFPLLIRPRHIPWTPDKMLVFSRMALFRI